MTRLLSLALALAAAGAPLALAAQEDATPAFICWRGRPLPHCSGVAVFEIQGGLSVASTTRHITYPELSDREERAFDHRLEWNLGLLRNVGPDWAVGGVVTLDAGPAGPLTAARVRVRRWLNPPASAELEVGVVGSDMGERWGRDALLGPSVGARLNAGDHASLFIRWDGVRSPPFIGAQDRGGFGAQVDGGFHQAFYVGVSLGHTWALVASAVLGGLSWVVPGACC